MVALDIYFAVGTLSLTIQIAIIALLIYGYNLKRKFKFHQHGKIMATAVILHLITIATTMVPAYVLAVIPFYILKAPLMLVSVVGLIHSVAGSTAFALGIWLVAAWGFKKDFNGCFIRKRFMVAIFCVWMVALSLGILLYAIFYGPAWLN
jgi:hypothetical protein